MKNLIMMMVGAAAIGAVAQEIPMPAPVPVPVAAVGTLEELEAGALCRTYLVGDTRYHISDNRCADEIIEFLSNAVPVDQGYDEKSAKFDGKNVAKHQYNLAVWEGVFVAKVAGKYVFTADSRMVYGIKVNGTGIKMAGQGTFAVDLQKGPNQFCMWRVVNKDWGDSDNYLNLDYRLATSKKAAKPITPAMLMHVAEEEEEW